MNFAHSDAVRMFERFAPRTAYRLRMTGDPGRDFRGLRAAALDRDDDLDPRFRALAEGTLSDEETAALKAEADQTEEGRLLWEMYRPFDAEEEQRLFDTFRRRQERKKWGFRVMTSVALAAAALAPLYFHLRDGGVDPRWIQVRGPETAPVLSTADTELTEAIGASGRSPTLVVRGSLLAQGDLTRPWKPRVNPASPDNIIYIAGTKKTVFPCVPAGTWEMLVAVGKEGKTLTDAEVLAGDKRDYKVLRRRVVLEGAAVDEAGNPCGVKTP